MVCGGVGLYQSHAPCLAIGIHPSVAANTLSSPRECRNVGSQQLNQINWAFGPLHNFFIRSSGISSLNNLCTAPGWSSNTPPTVPSSEWSSNAPPAKTKTTSSVSSYNCIGFPCSTCSFKDPRDDLSSTSRLYEALPSLASARLPMAVDCKVS